ncbi:MAG TPA: cytochrome c biogenesis protein CcsA [Candidatus Polarisedimenticolaceae bacterium]|nr:cytochrome c biogenesis protein CcsA [Candidatus Polarisedimenticolaceae bacterium]
MDLTSASALLPVTVIGYIVAVVTVTIRTIYRAAAARRLSSAMFVLTWVLHSATVVQLGLANGRLPLATGAEYLLVLGWVVLTLHLYVWFKLSMEVAGVVLPPLAGAMTFGAMQLIGVATPAAVTRDAWFLFHTTVSTLGIAILSVAFAMSVLYLLQDRALKSKKTLAMLERLPSLQKADQIGFRSLTIGFVLLTLGIATGVVVNAEVYQRLVVLGPKQVFPLLAWLIFAGVLIARPTIGFRGRKSAYLTITGFAFGLMTVIGMTL